MQGTGPFWHTRSERENLPEDQAAIRRILEAAFETSFEADLVDALRVDQQYWIQRYSMLGLNAADTPAGNEPAASELDFC